MSTLGLDSDDRHEPVLATVQSTEAPSSKWTAWKINLSRSNSAAATSPTNNNNNNNNTADHSLALAEEGDYTMMKTQHGNTTTTSTPAPSTDPAVPPFTPRHNILFSSEKPRKKKPNIFHFHPLVTLEEKYAGDEYFLNRSRKPFLQSHLALNAHIPLKKRTKNDNTAPASTESSSSSSNNNNNNNNPTGEQEYSVEDMVVEDGAHSLRLSQSNSSLNNVLTGIHQSTLTYYHDGKLQIRLPKDDVRLIMDPFIPPGILSVERNAGKTFSSSSSSSLEDSKHESAPPLNNEATDYYVDEEQGDMSRLLHHNRSSDLNYVLTVDPNLYKHVLEEISDSQWPCGVYWCCREAGEEKDEGVSINIAIGLLVVVFFGFFLAAFVFPDDATNISVI